MTKETNNEIDLLLRRMARRDDGARNGEAQTAEQHLDADEISSYAHNALPPGARARYTEHLADCSTCRKLVTELSLSLGSAAVADSTEQAHGASSFLHRFFASLFSPLVLRYAVPALGVIVVMIVGFLFWRQQARSEFEAKLDQRREVSTGAPFIAPATPAPSTPADVSGKPQAVNGLERGNTNEKSAQPKSPARSDTAAAAAPPTAAPATVAPAKDDRAVDETKPGAVADSAAPAAAKAAPTPQAQTETVVISKNQPTAALQTVQPAPPKEPARDEDQQKRVASSNKTAQDKAQSAPSVGGFSGGVRGLSARRREGAKPENEKKDGETAQAAKPTTADEQTRTIAGRRFRKQRGIWIDTGYESSTATVDMTRDSEQFRALVADEPAIGTISRQLDGEVIVVWKGHAYRIR